MKQLLMKTRRKYWLWLQESDSKLSYWLYDNHGDRTMKLFCIMVGHEPIHDHCGMPKHDYCIYCHKMMPGLGRS